MRNSNRTGRSNRSGPDNGTFAIAFYSIRADTNIITLPIAERFYNAIYSISAGAVIIRTIIAKRPMCAEGAERTTAERDLKIQYGDFTGSFAIKL